MKQLLKYSVVTVIAACAFSSPAQAQIPTIDVAAIAEAAASIEELRKQLTALETQIQQGTDLLNVSDEIFASLTGLSADIANLSNSMDIHNLPGSIQDLDNRISLLKTQYGVTDAAVVFETAPNVSSETRATYDLHQDSVLATLETSNTQIEVSGDTLARYEAFREELRLTADMKASIDLNTRVAIENGLLLSQLLSAQAMNNQLMSAEQLKQINQEQYTEANADKWIYVEAAE